MSQETLLFRKFRKSNIIIIDLRKCCIITRLRSQTSLPQTHASFFWKKLVVRDRSSIGLYDYSIFIHLNWWFSIIFTSINMNIMELFKLIWNWKKYFFFILFIIPINHFFNNFNIYYWIDNFNIYYWLIIVL